MRYLVDTDWIINYLSGHAGIEARVNSLRSEGLAVSLLSLAELYEGVHRSRDPKEAEQRLWEFLEGLHVLGLDAETCRIFGKERARLRAAGALPGDIDLEQPSALPENSRTRGGLPLSLCARGSIRVNSHESGTRLKIRRGHRRSCAAPRQRLIQPKITTWLREFFAKCP